MLGPFGTFGHFGSMFGHLLDNKNAISKYRTFGPDLLGHFLDNKNAISKCRTFGPDLLGRPARLVQNLNLSYFFLKVSQKKHVFGVEFLTAF